MLSLSTEQRTQGCSCSVPRVARYLRLVRRIVAVNFLRLTVIDLVRVAPDTFGLLNRQAHYPADQVAAKFVLPLAALL